MPAATDKFGMHCAAAVATDLEVVLLALISDVARNYCFIRPLDNGKRVIEATIALRRGAVRLQETRNQAGIIRMRIFCARSKLAQLEGPRFLACRSAILWYLARAC